MGLTDIFLKLVDMSLSASWVALAVLALRLVLKKAPKWLNCLLWILVAFRLVCPFSFESALSLVSVDGAREMVEDMLDDYVGPSHTYWDITEEYDVAVNSGIQPIHGGEGHYYVVTGETPATEVSVVADYLAPVWGTGMAVMLTYALISYWRLRRKVAASVTVSGNVYLCDYIDTPFILGILKPKIYLPSSMDADSVAYVLAHERAHIQRRDHWWKPLGFLLLTIHWFNPVIWLAYVCLCRDIELACDEKVIREMGTDEKKAYSQALLDCSVSRHMIAACPLAFGEVGVKERVKTVLNYKKPAFWIILIAVIVLIIAAVCFLTDPIREEEITETSPEPIAEDVTSKLEIKNGVREAIEAFQNQPSYHIGIVSKTNKSEALTTYSVSQDWYNGNDWGRYIYFGEPKEFEEYRLEMDGHQFVRVQYYAPEGKAQSDTGWCETEFGENETGECWLRTFLWIDDTMELTDLSCAGDATDYTFTVKDEITASSYHMIFRLDANGNLIYAYRMVPLPNAEQYESSVYIYSYAEAEISEKLGAWHGQAAEENALANVHEKLQSDYTDIAEQIDSLHNAVDNSSANE